MRLRSRLTGRERADDSRPVVPGAYDLVGEAGDPLVRLLPDAVEPAPTVSFAGVKPNSLDTEAVHRVVEACGEGATWAEWQAVSPLVPMVSERARPTRLEHETEKLLPNLRRVCHRPRTLLRVEEERLAVSRARRIPERATASLVSHPGDWEHRTLRSIRPSRVLATQIEDEWDLYENRVAARLVDRLLVHFGRRLEELRRLQDLAEERDRFSDDAAGSHWRARRLYALWGERFGDDSEDELRRTRLAVERMQRVLQGLLQSPLYERVPRNRTVPVALQPTNILVSDPHYRDVAALWRIWARDAHVTPPTRAELVQQRQRDARHFDAFALLVVLRALRDLGYEATSSEPVLRGGELRLTARRGDLTLRWRQDGVTELASGHDVLRFVPLFAAIDGASAAGLVDALRREAQGAGECVLLLLDRPDEATPDTAYALDGWTSPRALAISPWSLDSAERVARVLNGWEARQRLPAYPTGAAIAPDPGVALPAWLRRDGARVLLVAPADDRQRRTFLSALDARRRELADEQEASRRAKRRFDPGRLRAVDELERLAAAAGALASLETCPVCPGGVAQSFEVRPPSGSAFAWSWWCRCVCCASEWGLRVCASCGSAFPTLVPDVRIERETVLSSARVLDRTFGRDVWADPCTRAGVWHCSSCGGCGGEACAGCAGRTAI